MSQSRIAAPLAVCAALAPLALDTYLPAFPAMAEFLGVSVHSVSTSVSIYIFTLALGQLIGGPLADRFGRKAIMRIGLAIFALASLAITQVGDLTTLLVLRVIQAFGGGWVMVCVPALVRDLTSGKAAAKLFSLIGLMTVAAPAIAPALGAYILHWSWQSIFVFLSVYSVFTLIILETILFKIKIPQRPEINPNVVDRPTPNSSPIKRYLSVIKTPSAMRFVLIQGMLFSVMMLFVTHASFVYQEHFQLSNSVFSMLFAANILIMWFTMLTNRVLLNHFPAKIILRNAAFIQACGVLALTLISIIQLPVFIYAPALMLTVGMIGATSPNCMACYMEYFGNNSGTAAAIIGAAQFGISGTISAISTMLPETIVYISLSQLICSAIAVVLLLYRRQ